MLIDCYDVISTTGDHKKEGRKGEEVKVGWGELVVMGSDVDDGKK